MHPRRVHDYANLQLTWQIGDLELASVTGWSDETRYYREENDRANYVTNPEASTFQSSEVDQEVWIQELRLASSGNEFWDWMIGGYYQDQEVETAGEQRRGVGGPEREPVRRRRPDDHRAVWQSRWTCSTRCPAVISEPAANRTIAGSNSPVSNPPARTRFRTVRFTIPTVHVNPSASALARA